jgi:hypothetical protein
MRKPTHEFFILKKKLVYGNMAKVILNLLANIWYMCMILVLKATLNNLPP